MAEGDIEGRNAFNIMYSMATFNTFCFPIGLIVKYATAGNNESIFENVHEVSTGWHFFWWGFFLIVFTSDPTWISLAWIPYIFSAIVVFPLDYYALISYDPTVSAEEPKEASVMKSEWGNYDDFDG